MALSSSSSSSSTPSSSSSSMESAGDLEDLLRSMGDCYYFSNQEEEKKDSSHESSISTETARQVRDLEKKMHSKYAPTMQVKDWIAHPEITHFFKTLSTNPMHRLAALSQFLISLNRMAEAFKISSWVRHTKALEHVSAMAPISSLDFGMLERTLLRLAFRERRLKIEMDEAHARYMNGYDPRDPLEKKSFLSLKEKELHENKACTLVVYALGKFESISESSDNLFPLLEALDSIIQKNNMGYRLAALLITYALKILYTSPKVRLSQVLPSLSTERKEERKEHTNSLDPLQDLAEMQDQAADLYTFFNHQHDVDEAIRKTHLLREKPLLVSQIEFLESTGHIVAANLLSEVMFTIDKPHEYKQMDITQSQITERSALQKRTHDFFKLQKPIDAKLNTIEKEIKKKFSKRVKSSDSLKIIYHAIQSLKDNPQDLVPLIKKLIPILLHDAMGKELVPEVLKLYFLHFYASPAVFSNKLRIHKDKSEKKISAPAIVSEVEEKQPFFPIPDSEAKRWEMPLHVVEDQESLDKILSTFLRSANSLSELVSIHGYLLVKLGKPAEANSLLAANKKMTVASEKKHELSEQITKIRNHASLLTEEAKNSVFLAAFTHPRELKNKIHILVERLKQIFSPKHSLVVFFENELNKKPITFDPFNIERWFRVFGKISETSGLKSIALAMREYFVVLFASPALLAEFRNSSMPALQQEKISKDMSVSSPKPIEGTKEEEKKQVESKEIKRDSVADIPPVVKIRESKEVQEFTAWEVNLKLPIPCKPEFLVSEEDKEEFKLFQDSIGKFNSSEQEGKAVKEVCKMFSGFKMYLQPEQSTTTKAKNIQAKYSHYLQELNTVYGAPLLQLQANIFFQKGDVHNGMKMLDRGRRECTSDYSFDCQFIYRLLLLIRFELNSSRRREIFQDVIHAINILLTKNQKKEMLSVKEVADYVYIKGRAYDRLGMREKAQEYYLETLDFFENSPEIETLRSEFKITRAVNKYISLDEKISIAEEKLAQSRSVKPTPEALQGLIKDFADCSRHATSAMALVSENSPEEFKLKQKREKIALSKGEVTLLYLQGDNLKNFNNDQLEERVKLLWSALEYIDNKTHLIALQIRLELCRTNLRRMCERYFLPETIREVGKELRYLYDNAHDSLKDAEWIEVLGDSKVLKSIDDVSYQEFQNLADTLSKKSSVLAQGFFNGSSSSNGNSQLLTASPGLRQKAWR